MGITQLYGMLNTLQNLQKALSEQMAMQLIKENPDKWNAVQQMFAGKNHKQQVNELRKLYQSKGMDLDMTARQYGITL